MTRRILADTGPLYARALSRDERHERAKLELAQLAAERYTLMVAYPTLLELHRLIMRRAYPAFAVAYLDALLKSCVSVNPSAEDYRGGLELAERYRDQKITLHDLTLGALSKTLGVPVWTFDADFDIMGAVVWRGA